MSLYQKLKEDRMQAMRVRNTEKQALLSIVLGDVDTRSKLPKADKIDDIASAVLTALKKSTVFTMEQVKDKNPAAFAVASKELEIIESYLPKMMSDAELTALVKEALDSGSVDKNLGAVMKFLVSGFKGKYDGSKARGIVETLVK